MSDHFVKMNERTRETVRVILYSISLVALVAMFALLAL